MSRPDSTPRLTCDERKQSILQAVKAVFAEKGFDGTTTKDLAKAAGVSEALIFKYFPDKESLFEAMCGTCSEGPDGASVREIMGLEPSTSTLILLTHFIVSKIIDGTKDEEADHRLMMWSLLKDGQFARVKLKTLFEHALNKIEQCVAAAQKTGDLADVPVRRDLRVWFCHHTAAVVRYHMMPEPPALDYTASKRELVEQVTWFVLLGMGVKPEVIKQHYRPKALSLLSR